MGNLAKHLKVVRTHRKYVRRMCFKMGIPWQGLVHDLSKYSLKELSIARFYGGNRSPHEVARQVLGYSPAWMYHKNRNKHHWEFWLDNQDGIDFKPVKIPYKYVIEMFCDMTGASKAYNKNNWEPKMVWDYWINRCKGQRLMHPESEYLLEKLIWNLYQLGERGFFKRYREMKKYLKDAYRINSLALEVGFDA